MTAARRLGTLFLLLAASVLPLAAQDLASFEKRVTVRKLDNGLTLIVMQRSDAPVFSYITYINAGSAQDMPGSTGLAHMFEHMAFKGTDKIGTTDAVAEAPALAKVEEAYARYDLARRDPVTHDDAKVAQLQKGWKDAIAEADKFVVQNEFFRILDRAGAQDVNAGTSEDQTAYTYSIPSNRFELWAYLESERFLHPVFREFYKERDVVTEERRYRTESNPIGRLIEQFLAASFTAHSYGQPTVGWPSDLQTFSATDARAFYKKFYVPSNMVIAIVGDVKASEVMPMLVSYFGRLPKGPAPEPLRTIEPAQTGERTVLLREATQPFYVEGYHRPATTDPDNATFTVISDLMSNGRTSRLYRSLVRDKKIAAASAGFNGFPGQKYPNLFVAYAVPTPGHTAAELAEPIRAEIERLKNEDVPADELQAVKTRAKASLIRQLDSNDGLASQLAAYQTLYGDWRELFREVDKIDKVTPADIRRVANRTFVASNRTVGSIESAKPAATAAAAPSPAKGDSK